MKSPYLWILFVLLLIPRFSVADQYPWIDSLRQKIPQTPDSLKGADFVALGQYYWNLRENHPGFEDSLLKYARIAYQSGLVYQDTPVIRDGLSQMRNYYRYVNKNEIADSLQERTQFYTAEYGYELPGYFNNNNEEAGYRYAHIYNTLYIYDATGRDLDFKAVSDSSFRDSFFINNSPLSKIKPESVYWMRLRLRGSSKRTDDYLFMIGYDSYSWGRAEIYLPDEEGVYQKYLSGNEVDPEDKPIDDWRNFFEVYVPQNQSVWVYIKVWEPLQVQKLAYIFLREINRESLIENEKSSAMTRGIFHGVVSIQAIYFLLLFLSTRVRSYLFYVIYILGLGLFIGNANYFNLLFPHHGYYEILGFYLAVGISAFGMIRFGENFLDTREVLPRWRHTGNLFLGIFFFFLFLSMVLKTWDVPWLNEENLRFWAAVSDNLLDTMILICILGLILILIWGILAYRRGNESAKYFVIALLFLAAGFTIPGISKVFNISYGWITFNSAMLSVQAGIILQLSFFALGVGHKRKQLDLDRQDVLKQANDKLRRADELKDEFLANTSHELRTPLNGIIGIAESLAEGVAGPVNQEMEKNLGLIISSGKRLAGLVNDLLDFSKLRSRELELKLIPIDLRSLVKVVLTMIRPMVKNKNIILKNEISADLKPINGDENRLQQVLFNLIGNAIKFTHEGEIVIRAWEENGFNIISVRDTGIGIDPEKHEKIFESFEQADGSVAREYGGTGLGLSISRQLIELHGGKIWVESTVGEGAEFFISLPVSSESALQIQPDDLDDNFVPEVLRENSIAQNKKILNGNAVRILVVDDEPINHQVLNNHLSDDHYAITSAMNGEEALELIKAGKMFDLVLLDVMMPRMSGYEVCQKIREKYLPSELPVIMITAKNQVSDLVEGLNFGANDYISKPFSRQEFLARVKTHLNLFNINSAYGRFVPHEFLHSLGHDFITEVKLGDQVEKEVTVFFSDIRSYTTLSEQMTPKENFDFLNSYLGRVGPVIKANHGFVNQYVGDGIMALFQTSPEDALEAAIQIQYTLRNYNEDRKSLGRIPIKVGIGLHTGALMMGIIGDQERMDAGVVSDTVNTASRMEGLTKYYGVSILISESVIAGIDREKFLIRYLGKVQVKGKVEPIDVFDCYQGDDEKIKERKIKSVEDFEKGIQAYLAKDFKVAAEAFKEVLKINRSDRTAKMYLNQIDTLLKKPLPTGWTGVVAMDSK